jgi:hypothetical protein
MTMGDRKFTPFPQPIHADDTPLVRHAGAAYKCSGCGGHVPDGVHLAEQIKDGMVVGLVARLGWDGPVVHKCGTVDDGEV